MANYNLTQTGNEVQAYIDSIPVIDVTGTLSGSTITFGSNPYSQIAANYAADCGSIVRLTVGTAVYLLRVTQYDGTNYTAAEMSGAHNVVATIGSSSASATIDVGIDATPTQGSDNLVKSGGVYSEVSQLGQQVIYDVSANNDEATFASLSALLSSENLSTLIPIAVRCGGMSIRFVQSSDNKYVQYLYRVTDAATAATFTNVANWEKVNLEEELELLEQKTIGIGYGKNLYTGLIESGYIKTDGTISASDNYYHTDYIQVEPSTAYYASCDGDVALAGNSTNACFYDLNKKSIGYQQSSVKSFTTPANCYYMRFTINLSRINSVPQIEKGSARTTYERGSILYKYLQTGLPTGVVDMSAISDTSKDKEPTAASPNIPLSGGVITFGERNYVPLGCKNLFDGVWGEGYIKPNGAIGANSSYFYSEHYIAVKPETSYCITRAGNESVGTNSTNIIYYGVSKNVLSYGAMGNNKVFTTPLNCYYIRFSAYSSKRYEVQVEEGNSRTVYEPFNPIYKYIRSYDAAQAQSLIGTDAAKVSADTLAANTKLELSDFPAYCKEKTGATVIAFFSSFSDLYFGKEGRHGLCLKIDATNVYFVVDLGLETEYTPTTITHGLTISDFLKVIIYQTVYATFRIILFTKEGIKVIDTETHYDFSNVWSVKSSGALTNVQLTATCGGFRCPVWCFGDSYFGYYNNRIGGVLQELGFKNVYWANLLGGHGYNLQPDFALALNYGTPKYAVWGIGQNDVDSDSAISANWLHYTNLFIALCIEKGITPILCTIPNVSGDGNLRNHSFKNAWIKASGYRYIDTEKAVGAQADGTWYPGMLNDDEVHPTRLGAQAIVTQWLVDFPEIMEYGLLNEDITAE